MAFRFSQSVYDVIGLGVRQLLTSIRAETNVLNASNFGLPSNILSKGNLDWSPLNEQNIESL